MINFDDKERKLEEGPLDFVKKLAPVIIPIINRPEKISIQMKVTPKQLEDITKLVKKWESEQPSIEELVSQIE